MKRRHIRRCILWLLPLFALRAVVPAGFMLAAHPQGLAITLCPGVSGAPFVVMPQIVRVHDAHAEHGGHAQDNTRHARGEAPCPFAVVGGWASANVTALLGDVVAARPSPPRFIRSRHCRFGPVTADRTRAPPAPLTALVA